MKFHPPSLQLTSLVLALALTACGSQSLDDNRYPTGSQTLTSSSDYSRVYVANLDAGTVSVLSQSGSVLAKVDVGLEPTRIARAGDKVVVTLRGERSIAILSETPDGLSSAELIEVGPEPYGVVCSEDGAFAYVAISQGEEVVEIDMSQRQITRRFSVKDQPAFLALHPSEKALYVGSLMNGTATYIDLRGEGEVHTMDLPKMTRFKDIGDEEFFEGLGIDGPVAMSNRITGDLAVSADGKYIAIPTLSLDNTSPADNPNGDDISGGGGYASSGGGIGRFNPSVVILSSTASGKPGLEDAVTVFSAGTDLGFNDLRSYINSVTFSPNGMTILASMEGSDAVLVIPQNPEKGKKLDADEFDTRAIEAIVTGAGPRGVTFLSEKQAFVHNFLDNEVADTNYQTAFDRLANRLGGKGSPPTSTPELSDQEADGEFHIAVVAEPGVAVEDETLSVDVAEGRRMFFGATDTRVAVRGGGVSCATCHFESRNDGVTWQFTDGKARQTPSLAGDLSFQEKFTWTDDVPSVSAEARMTSVDRMGGSGLTISESRQIEQFVNGSWYPDSALTGIEDASAMAGKALFEREDVGCATCHSGENLTDQKEYAMFGLNNVRTPALMGVAATGPYLHDGRANTLEQVLQLSDGGLMGDTSMLSDAEKADLVYYLKTL